MPSALKLGLSFVQGIAIIERTDQHPHQLGLRPRRNVRLQFLIAEMLHKAASGFLIERAHLDVASPRLAA